MIGEIAVVLDLKLNDEYNFDKDCWITVYLTPKLDFEAQKNKFGIFIEYQYVQDNSERVKGLFIKLSFEVQT